MYVQLWCGGDGRAPGERQRKRAAELAPRVPAEGGRRRQPAAARDGEAQGMLVYSIISYCQLSVGYSLTRIPALKLGLNLRFSDAGLDT